MPDITQSSLVLFEQERKNLNYIPPARSNQAFVIDSGMIVLSTIRDEPDDHKFYLRIQNRNVPSGYGKFSLTGSSIDIVDPYSDCLINTSAKLIVNDELELKNDASIENNGILEFDNNSKVIMSGSSKISIPSNATITIKNNVEFNLSDQAKIVVYGTVNIQYSSVLSFFDIYKNIEIDHSATVNIVGLPTNRSTSLTQFITEMNNKFLPGSISENRFLGDGFVTFACTDGDPRVPYEVSTLIIENGSNVLGDFKLSIVGVPIQNTSNLQVLSELRVNKDATLYISEEYRGFQYIAPCLFLSQIFANTKDPGVLNIYGKVIVNGANASIFMDKGGNITIHKNGTLAVENGAKIFNNFRSKVLTINGTLILDNENQLDGFVESDIEIGPDGKIIIMNPNNGVETIVFSTPVGISLSYLYQLFGNRLKFVEYHIPDHAGIKIDMFYEHYTDMNNWYGGMTLEEAIQKEYIIWNRDSYIELNHEIIDWVNESTTLLDCSNMFMVFGENDHERLQRVVDRFLYTKMEVLKFKIVDQEFSKYLYLNLGTCKIVDALFDYEHLEYLLITDAKGQLYLRNAQYLLTVDDIISNESRMVPIISERTTFNL